VWAWPTSGSSRRTDRLGSLIKSSIERRGTGPERADHDVRSRPGRVVHPCHVLGAETSVYARRCGDEGALPIDVKANAPSPRDAGEPGSAGTRRCTNDVRTSATPPTHPHAPPRSTTTRPTPQRTPTQPNAPPRSTHAGRTSRRPNIRSHTNPRPAPQSPAGRRNRHCDPAPSLIAAVHNRLRRPPRPRTPQPQLPARSVRKRLRRPPRPRTPQPQLPAAAPHATRS
jgi:hypothetical protein